MLPFKLNENMSIVFPDKERGSKVAKKDSSKANQTLNSGDINQDIFLKNQNRLKPARIESNSSVVMGIQNVILIQINYF